MPYKPSDSYVKGFVTSSPTTGAAANADSTPVATANRNGADDAAFVLTVTNIDAGRYKITGTVPSGYARGDVLNVSVAATVGGVAGKAVVDTQVLDSKRVGDLNDIAATAIVSNGAITTNGSGKVSGVVLTDTVTTYTGNTPQTGDSYARIGAAGAGLTGITGATLSAAYDPAKTAAQATNLASLVTTVGVAGAGLTAVADTAGTGTLLGRLSSTRSGYLDNLSAGAVALHADVTGLATATALSALATTVGSAGAGLSSIPYTGPSSSTLATAVRDIDNTSPASNSLGARVNSASSSGDPLANAVPGSYSAGTAGYVLGHKIAATLNATDVTGNLPANLVTINGQPALPGDGTATAVSSSTITIPSAADLAGWTVRVLSATTGADQSAVILSSNTGTGQQTLTAAWGVTPTGTVVYQLTEPVGRVVGSVGGVAGNVSGNVSGSVASVANLAGIALSTGTVSASPPPTTTTFTATGNLNATPGGYTTAPMSVVWQAGANAGFKYPIAGHAVSGSNHAFTVSAPMAGVPAAGDRFVIG